jgi:hypothetical protein
MVTLTRQSWMRLSALGALALCFLVFTGCEAIWTLLRDDRQPNRYLIPEGFVGWVRIDYEVEGAPELPVQDGFRVYRIPPSGLLKTSSAVEAGWASDEYCYVDTSGAREQLSATTRGGGGLIWPGGFSLGMSHEFQNGVSTSRSTGVAHEQFFVGPEELAQKQPHQNEHGEPLYGPVPASDAQ